MKMFPFFHSQPEFLIPPGVESLWLDRGGPYELGRQSVRDDAVTAHAVFPLEGGAQLLQAGPPLAPKTALRVEFLIRTVATLEWVGWLNTQHTVRVAET